MPETLPQSLKLSKRFQKNIALTYIYQLTNWSKMHPVWCSNTHRDVTNFVNPGMAKNTKTWISWERKIIFVWNKKILNLCLRWHILRSYRFAAGVNFKLTLIWNIMITSTTCEIHLNSQAFSRDFYLDNIFAKVIAFKQYIDNSVKLSYFLIRSI